MIQVFLKLKREDWLNAYSYTKNRVMKIYLSTKNLEIMKKLIMATMVLSVVYQIPSSFSNAIANSNVEVLVQDKMSVKPEDLPEPIKSTLAAGAYASWEVTEAFLITRSDKTQYFEIIVKKGSEMSKINLDKDGRKVE